MWSNDIKLGRIFGIEIYISYSWFFIFILVTASLAFGLFPSLFPRHSVVVNIISGLFASFLFFASLLFHEMSHSLIANKNGIPIKKITLFIFGGMSQMSEEPRDPGSEFKMAVAGPLSSFFLAGAFFAIFKLMISAGASSIFFAPFAWLAEINLLLAIFNLMPGFPLDGGRVLRAAIWYQSGNYERATNIAAKAGQVIAFSIMGLGLLLFLFGQLGGAWLILIGWFLNQSAIGSSRQIILQHTLANISVRDIMSADVSTVGPEMNLEDLVNHYFLRHRFGRFPVVSDGHLQGIVTLHDVKDIDRSRWPVVTAGEIIEPLKSTMLIKPDQPALNALVEMANDGIGHLLVVDEQGELVGIVTKTDILNLIRVRGELDI